ncbi:matrix metalloproteinase-14-like [Glandiceps talaboti]
MATVIKSSSLFMLLVICVTVRYIHASPSQQAQGVDFLRRYGYLPMPDLQSGQLNTKDELQDAIIIMQRFANLPETGELDSDTLAMMGKARCGVPDMMGTAESARKRRYAHTGSKWDHNDLTYRIENFTPDLDPEDTRRTIRKAFDFWQDASALTFTEIYDYQYEPDIRIQFVRGYHGDAGPFDGPGGTLAHAYFPGKGIGGDCHFDDDEAFTINTYEGINLEYVATHEFGHSLGLGHSSSPGALMGPYYQGYNPHFQLPDDDRIGIQSLYGPNRDYTQAPNMPDPTNAPDDPMNPTMEPCSSGFDAIGSIRGEIFFFKENVFWRLREKGRALTGYPHPNENFWYDLPSGVNAVYERYDHRIVFLKDSHYYIYSTNYQDPGYPQYISNIGLPRNIDAALVWGNNGKTFFFKGKKYWRYDEVNHKVDPGYPKLISEHWTGIPNNLNAAFEWKDGYTYFFKGDDYWQFNSNTMKVEPGYPRNAARDWLGCNRIVKGEEELEDGESGPVYSSAVNTKVTAPIVIFITSVLVLIL